MSTTCPMVRLASDWLLPSLPARSFSVLACWLVARGSAFAASARSAGAASMDAPCGGASSRRAAWPGAVSPSACPRA
jgi:hypothetical protein